MSRGTNAAAETATSSSGNNVLMFKILIILLSILYRWSISLHPYSGQGKPPMFGDYEAQRHWMEITFNLNVKDWYHNTTENDLNYWGLDYPPLTAYHSYAMGYIANIINPKYVKLKESRGIESNEHKLFMRMSVLIFDLVVFYPSVLFILGRFYRQTQAAGSSTRLSNVDNDYLVCLLLVLLNPTLTLIDYGHFQYNSISIGLLQLSIYFLLLYNDDHKRRSTSSIGALVLASTFFTLALNYKQMELYHSLPIFFYLLAICFKSNIFSNGFLKLIFIGGSVVLTFLILWLPFILQGKESILQVLIRIFPFNRGLYEDKVANFWCSISPVFKVKEKFSIEQMSKISVLTTLIAVLPSCVQLFFRPSRQRFLLALVISSLGFYLFSFHVHEKTILLATAPACFLINHYPAIISLFLMVANFSMLPLFYKDGLTFAYVCTTCVFALIVFIYYYLNEHQRENGFWPKLNLGSVQFINYTFNVGFKIGYVLSMLMMIPLQVVFLYVKPPAHLPDLWTLLICAFSCVHFVMFMFLFYFMQFTLRSDKHSSSTVKSRAATSSQSVIEFETSLSNFLTPIDRSKKSQ